MVAVGAMGKTPSKGIIWGLYRGLIKVLLGFVKGVGP